MLRTICQSLKIPKSSIIKNSPILTRFYHSYPDPNEKAVITTSVSTVKKTIEKPTTFENMKKFKMDELYSGFDESLNKKPLEKPITQKHVMSNGLVIASQETTGLMQSFAFLVNIGRYIVPHFITSYFF
jgi:hypothetical protein